MSSSTFGFGVSRFARNSNRNLVGDSIGVARYPSPFFDVAHTYLPSSIRELLEYCSYYFLTNGFINAVCFKMAEYPITNLVIDGAQALIDQWRPFLHKTLKIKKLQVEIGLDYNVYGNCFLSVSLPFHKTLICKACGHSKRVERQRYVFRSNGFYGTCGKCGYDGEFRVRDIYIKAAERIRVIRWCPEYMIIRHNEATGENDYFYRVPPSLANDIRMGKRHVVEKTPQIFLEAVRHNKAIAFNAKNLFHLRRPNIAQKDRGWGLPMPQPVLKDVYYLNILRKGQEAVVLEHIIPMRCFFPAIPSGTAEPYSTINLRDWKRHVEAEILKWRLDNNYIPVFPLPMGTQTIGGDGRALLLTQEYRVWMEAICVGMQVPVEFVFGGLSFSGSNVSLRMVENHFSHYRADQLAFLEDFLIPIVAAFMNWQTVKVHFEPFKMADDLQRNAFNLQLNQAGKISDDSLLESSSWNAQDERAKIKRESQKSMELQRDQMLAQARIQAQAQNIMTKAQMQLQQEAAEAGMGGAMPGAQQDPMAQASAGGAGAEQDPLAAAQSPLGMQNSLGFDDPAQAPPASFDIRSVADKIAARLDQLDAAAQAAELEALKLSSPNLYSLVTEALELRRGAHQSSASKPMPTSKPPRRGPEARMV